VFDSNTLWSSPAWQRVPDRQARQMPFPKLSATRAATDCGEVRLLGLAIGEVGAKRSKDSDLVRIGLSATKAVQMSMQGCFLQNLMTALRQA